MTASVDAGEDRRGKLNRRRVVHCSDGCYDEIVDLPDATIGGSATQTRSGMTDVTLSLRLLREVCSLPRKALKAADWAGERLAGMVGITNSRFDVYLWQREYEIQKQTEEETSNFIIDPVSPRDKASLPMEVRKNSADGQGGT